MSRPGVSVLFGVVLAAIPTAARDATEWGQITAADRALREVSFAPNAPAVILEEDIRYTVALGNEPSSTEVYRRIKILNQEGMRAGTVKLQVNDYNRVRDLQARTMLPDGRELALPADAVFRTEESSSDGEERLAFALRESSRAPSSNSATAPSATVPRWLATGFRARSPCFAAASATSSRGRGPSNAAISDHRRWSPIGRA